MRVAPRIEPGTDVAAPIAEERPVDTAGQMAEDARDSKTETDGGVRSHHPKRVQADETEQGRQAKRAEDETDEAAEQADQRAGDDCCAHVRFSGRPTAGRAACERSRSMPKSSSVTPIVASRARRREPAGEETAGDGADHGGRGHPPEEPPVDASGTDVGDRARESCAGRDSDVRARAGRRARGREHDHGQPDVPENEADEAAEQRSREAPKADNDEDQGVQPLEYPA